MQLCLLCLDCLLGQATQSQLKTWLTLMSNPYRKATPAPCMAVLPHHGLPVTMVPWLPQSSDLFNSGHHSEKPSPSITEPAAPPLGTSTTSSHAQAPHGSAPACKEGHQEPCTAAVPPNPTRTYSQEQTNS